MPLSKGYPIAERFTSIQGEGAYCGTLMHFIRLAGCNVGKYCKSEGPIPREPDCNNDTLLYLEKIHSKCTSVLDQQFICDTDYRSKERWTANALAHCAHEANVEHVCITGGEPFIHDLVPLVEALGAFEVHIETSGTILIPDYAVDSQCWVTCSPKHGFLRDNVPAVDEFKFVIDTLGDEIALQEWIELHGIPERIPIFVQPVNLISEIDKPKLDLVLAMLERNPRWRLSVQLHKLLGVR